MRIAWLLLYIEYVDSLSNYDYELPEEMIANAPTQPRDACQMLVYHRGSKTTQIKKFYNIVDELHTGDVVVINETKVIPARLIGHKSTGAQIEILLLKKINLSDYEVLVKPMRRVKIGDTINIADQLFAKMLSKNETDGTAIMQLTCHDSIQNLEAIIDKVGEIPLPHYIRQGHATKEN